MFIVVFLFLSGCVFSPPARHLHIPATTSSTQPIRVHHQEAKGWFRRMVHTHCFSLIHFWSEKSVNDHITEAALPPFFALPPGGPFQHTPDLYQSSGGSPPPSALPCMTLASQPPQPPCPTHAAVALAQQQPVTIQVQEVELGGGAQRQSFLATPCHRVLGKQLSADNAETHRC